MFMGFKAQHLLEIYILLFQTLDQIKELVRILQKFMSFYLDLY
jgi:hypothetical protein